MFVCVYFEKKISVSIDLTIKYVQRIFIETSIYKRLLFTVIRCDCDMCKSIFFTVQESDGSQRILYLHRTNLLKVITVFFR